MFQNGVQMNRHANIRKHKRRLRKIEEFHEKLFYQKASLPGPVTIESKWCGSIYDSWKRYNKRRKKQYHRRIRNLFKDKINRYLKDEDYELSYCDTEVY